MRFLVNDFYHDVARCHERALIRVESVLLRVSGSYTINTGFYAIHPYFRLEENFIPRLMRGRLL
jgi:hypothetical protein